MQHSKQADVSVSDAQSPASNLEFRLPVTRAGSNANAGRHTGAAPGSLPAASSVSYQLAIGPRSGGGYTIFPSRSNGPPN